VAIASRPTSSCGLCAGICSSPSASGISSSCWQIGVQVDHVTLYRWIQRFAAEIEARVRRHLRPCRGPWHVDETYVRIGGGWRYLYRAVDVSGQTIDFLLSAERDLETARRFFRRALGRSDTSHPRTIITDRLVSYREAVRAMKRAGEIWRFPRHRRGRWLNNWSSRIAAG
jgi:transposase, IS6 family